MLEPEPGSIPGRQQGVLRPDTTERAFIQSMAGLIPQDFISDLVARADIVEVIGRRVQLKKAGREFKACCPFHDEKTRLRSRSARTRASIIASAAAHTVRRSTS